jgi:lipopolysaccharide heptosyltransferase II
MIEQGDWTSARNIVCFRLDTLGDVLMTAPAIRALKEAVPDRRVTLVTSGPGAEAAALVPHIDRIMVYAAPWLKATPQKDDGQADREWIQQLRAARFDAAVIFTVFSQSALPAALTCYLADIPLRLAYCRENPYQLLTNWIPDPDPEQGIRHEVQRQLDLVASVGAPSRDHKISIRVSAAARSEARQVLLRHGIDPQQPWLVIHPGATAASRRYPPEQFAAVARGLVARGFQVALTGSQGEADLIAQIQHQAEADTVSLAGELGLEQLAALISMAPLLIANNTGPVHIAAAVGTPVVDLYALTNPQHTPWQVPQRVLSHDVPCKYCFKSICPEQHNDCLRLITPQEVVHAALELLAETRGNRESSESLSQQH